MIQMGNLLEIGRITEKDRTKTIIVKTQGQPSPLELGIGAADAAHPIFNESGFSGRKEELDLPQAKMTEGSLGIYRRTEGLGPYDIFE